jgi:hypothetical protein
MYQWAGYGPQQMIVVAENCDGSGQADHTIEITTGPWTYISVPMVMR